MEKEKVSEKRERFVRIAEKRVNNILQTMDSLGNCSNKKNYEFSDKDVKEIFSVLEKKVKETRQKFNQETSNQTNFKLKL